MRGRTVVTIVAACAIAMAPAVADTGKGGAKPAPAKPAPAKPGAKPTAKPTAKAKSTTRGKKSSSKRAANRKRGRGRAMQSNMPRGWSWPPTKSMIAAGEACTKQLDAMGIVWQPAANEDGGRIVTPITVPAMELGGLEVVSAWRKPPFVMDCHLALGLAVYAPLLESIGVEQLKFSSIFRNTKVRAHGQTKNMLSRHALGLAIDVRAFIDGAGREAVVETDYAAADTMLLGIEQVINDSGGFRTVLTPRNDPVSHYDHFHLEIKVDYDHVAAQSKPVHALPPPSPPVDPAPMKTTAAVAPEPAAP